MIGLWHMEMMLIWAILEKNHIIAEKLKNVFDEWIDNTQSIESGIYMSRRLTEILYQDVLLEKMASLCLALNKPLAKKGKPQGMLHIRKCPLRRFKEFVGITKYIAGNYNEIII